MANPEFERLRGVFEDLAVKHMKQYLLDREGNELQMAQKYYAAARDLPLQLEHRAGNQVTYNVLRELLADVITCGEIAEAMGWSSSETPAPLGPPIGVRASPQHIT